MRQERERERDEGGGNDIRRSAGVLTDVKWMGLHTRMNMEVKGVMNKRYV